jgi:phosphoglycolate phosphatase
MDGTLVDSRAEISTCMDLAFEAAGLPAPGYDRTRLIVGLSLAPALQRLAPDADEATRSRILEAYREAFFARRQNPAHVPLAYAGTQALLDRLHQDGWVLGIATGKSRRGLNALLESAGWTKLFTTTWCADDGPSKPHPFMVTQNMADVGALPGQTIMIGDTDHDIAMARAAGTRAQGVSWGFGTTREMMAAGAAHVADTMDELEAQLQTFAASIV